MVQSRWATGGGIQVGKRGEVMSTLQFGRVGACRLALLSGLAVAAIGVSAPASAQGDAAPKNANAEADGARDNIIIVTARKREESLQEVPLAVTAITSSDIESSSAETIDQLERFAPNVDLANNSFGAKQLNATIRGVGFADVEKSFEPAVGFSIDGVFLGTSGGASIDVFDIESVEILRGPQGTLYGRNTVGGVINVRRTRPTDDAGFRGTVRFGDHGREEYLAVGNTGRFGDLALKGYVFRTKSKTFSRNLATGKKDKLQDNLSFGAALSYEPNDDFSANISVDVFDDDSGQNPNYNLSLPNATFCLLTLIPPPNNVVAPQSTGAGCIDASFTVAQQSGFKVHRQSIPVLSATDGFSITSNIDWTVGDDLTLSSVSGYRKSDELLRTDNLGNPLVTLAAAPVQVPIFFATRFVKQEQFSQELRLSGTSGDRLDFVTGVYYLYNNYALSGGDGPFGPPAFGGTFVFGGLAADVEVEQDTQAYAIFGDATYKLTDRLSLSAGLRWSYEKKDIDIAFLFGAAAGQTASPSVDFDAFTWRAILQYDFSDDVMGFAGWSRGFRSGGFNGRAQSAALIGPYGPETVDNFEGGFRVEMLDRRIRFNPTVFYTSYRDKQEEVSRPSAGGVPETIVENAASARIWGVELETQAFVSDALTLRGSVGYLNAKYRKFLIPDPLNINAPPIDVSASRQLRRAPDWTFAVGGSYQRPLTSNLNVIATVDYSFMDKSASNLTRDTSGRGRDIIASTSSLDLTLGVKSDYPNGYNWSVRGYMVDATDDRNGRLAASLDVGVFYFGVGNVTRRYGVEFGFEF
jgi:iron complex outermembrane recepter protein